MLQPLVALLVAIATASTACAGDVPTSLSEPVAQPQQMAKPTRQQEVQNQSVARASARAGEDGHTRVPSPKSASEEGGEKRSLAETRAAEEASPDGEAAEVPKRQSSDVPATPVDAETEEAESISEEQTENLTNVPATIIKDAEVRVRPGLVWRVIDWLQAGTSVVVLQHAGGWYRIGYGSDHLFGWVRTSAVDIGALKPWWVLTKPAHEIVGDWQGDLYRVMGRSADGTEIRLLPQEDELGRITGAPVDKVLLLTTDVTTRDLPILLGDELVVFPGDDFRDGHGQVLPQADEWMWLPWGWLLAHNDTRIWQWRPSSDTLEFTKRPPGRARFSPNGQYLAIALCRPLDSGCWEDWDAIILPLDGAEPLSMRELVRNGRPDVGDLTGYGSGRDFQWTSDSTGVLVPTSYPGFKTHERTVGRTPVSYVRPTALLTVVGEVTLFVEVLAEHVGRDECYYGRYPWQSWRLREDDTVGIYVFCHDAEGTAEFDIVYDLDGALLRAEPWPKSNVEDEREQEIRSSDGQRALGETLQISWAPSARRAIVVSEETQDIWLFNSVEHELTLIAREGESVRIADDWGRGDWDIHWFADKLAVMAPRHIVLFANKVIVLDVTDESVAVFDVGRIDGLPCSLMESWSPDGDQVHVAFQANDLPEAATSLLWIDGTGIRNRSIGQHFIIDTVTKSSTVLRTFSHGSFRSSIHRAEWSPSGDWLAIGGNHDWMTCSLGH